MMKLRITTLRLTVLSIKTIRSTHNAECHNGFSVLSVINTEFHNAECRYTWCHWAEYHGTMAVAQAMIVAVTKDRMD